MMPTRPRQRGWGIQYPWNKIPEGKLRYCECNRCGGRGGWMVGSKFVVDRYCNGTGQVIRLKQTGIVRTVMGDRSAWESMR